MAAALIVIVVIVAAVGWFLLARPAAHAAPCLGCGHTET